MLHYSGYEDCEHASDLVSGPMEAARFRDELRHVANGRDIQSAEHGMVKYRGRFSVRNEKKRRWMIFSVGNCKRHQVHRCPNKLFFPNHASEFVIM
jgi:hypothetical protein